MFSGQGSLMPEAGRRLYARLPQFKATIDECSDYCGESLADIIWGCGRACRKNDPYYDHIATFAASLGLFRCLETSGIKPVLMMGHSLGEICATICAGALSTKDGFELISKRGVFFRANRKKNNADMVALIGEKEKIENSIRFFQSDHEIYPVNYNTANQVVVAIDSRLIPALRSICQTHGIKTVQLHIGNGCHCPFVNEIDTPLRAAINGIEFKNPKIPVFSANSIMIMSDRDDIKKNLLNHLLGPVNWFRSIEFIAQQSDCFFVEAGLSKILLGIVRRINRSLHVGLGYSLVDAGVATH